MNVRAQFEGKHPILIVQKDTPHGVPYDVDISFNNHLAVHKSHEVGRLLAEHLGAHSLAKLVKEWARHVQIKGPTYLASHAWMLLIIQYMASSSGERSEVGFFAWFFREFPPDKPWTVGNGRSPFEFESENVAQRVEEEQRVEIRERVRLASANLEQGELPWSKAKSNA